VGTPGSFDDATAASPTYTAPQVGRSGEVVTLRLTVTDDEGAQGSATVAVTVRNVNMPPVADAGRDAHTLSRDWIRLDGSGSSDADDDPLTYSWSILSAPEGSEATLTGADTSHPELVPDSSGLWEFLLTVSDGLAGAQDTVRVAVVEDPPVFACAGEDVSALPSTGALGLDSTSDVAPACGPYVFLGNRTERRVDLRDVGTGALLGSFGVRATPGRMLLHRPTSMLYVAHPDAPRLTKVNVATGEVREIPLAGTVVDLTVVDGDRMVVALEGVNGYASRLVLLDPLAEVVARTFAGGSFGLWLAYDPVNQVLLSGVAGMSPSALFRHRFDPEAQTLTLEQSSWSLGSNGQDLAASPAGGHAAFACGGGNGTDPRYTIFDLDTLDLARRYGEWNTGAYPSAVDFDAAGDRLLATNRGSLLVFDVASHGLTGDHAVSLSGCSYGGLRRVRFSPGGGVAYGLSDCGFDRTSARLFWFRP
jgi:hypothetical protein